MPKANDARFLRVLVVDDCADTRTSLRILLTLWGHEVAEAADGPSALEAASTFRPDAVLLDIALPRQDGYSVARALRTTAGPFPLLLVAVSGYADEPHMARARQGDFDHYLIKPLDLALLEQLLAARKAACAV
jgi:CheY-like chemotaxis protein